MSVPLEEAERILAAEGWQRDGEGWISPVGSQKLSFREAFLFVSRKREEAAREMALQAQDDQRQEQTQQIWCQFHKLWGLAHAHDYQKREWAALQKLLEQAIGTFK